MSTELVRQGNVQTSSVKEEAEGRSKSPGMMRIEEHPSWEMLAELRMPLRVVVTLKQFRVRDLLALKAGQVFASASSDTEDVALLLGQMPLGWSEFEVQEQRMAVRITRLG